MPFLNFKLGIQGSQTAMSFCVSEEDQTFNRDKHSMTKIIALLKLSQFHKKHPKLFTTDELVEKDVN
jgi:hypothetical protein